MSFKLAALATLAFTTPAIAQSLTSTYTFTGNCEICDSPNSPVTATLILRDYTPGTALTDANLVNLFYLSSQTIFDFQSGNLSGVLGVTPNSYNVSFRNLVDLGFFQITSTFLTYDTGVFSANPPFTDGLDIDRGNRGVWTLVGAPPMSPVPEPATWAMMIAGLGVAGLEMRRRRKTAAVRV